MTSFTIGDTDFLLDGQPHRVLSGALHYFRVHPDLWADRIHKAKLMGLNTIETYVAWNAHAPTRGEWDATGGLDLARFLDLVAAEGMHAIVRPGPYICAEWDNGGLPAWLLRDESVGVRRMEPAYIEALTEFLHRVYDIVVPRQIDRGGPVVLVQIENEYGAYGSDKEYLAELVRVTRDAGITVPLTTIDQPQPDMLVNGSIPGLHMTGSFGSRAEERLATLREHQKTGPLVCMEFWDGWFDDWGTHHHTTPAADSARELDTILAAGGSVNFYMFHGGTNFGLTNGANDKGRYMAITTSYDYDAPLDEAGNPTEKFFAFRNVLAKYAPVPDETPDAAAPAPAVSTTFTAVANLLPVLEHLGDAHDSVELPTFDELAHDRGIAVFTTTLEAGAAAAVLSFGEVRDCAWVLLDGIPVGRLTRDAHENDIQLPRSSGELTVIVEDQGRVNYGPRIGEHKGLIGGATLAGVPLTGWRSRPLDLDAIPALDLAPFAAGPGGAGAGTGAVTGGAGSLAAGPLAAGPLIARASFELDAPSDLFLESSSWGKGIAWVNGFCLGRYWRRGPQETLMVPGPVTRAGANELVILELEVLPSMAVNFVPELRLGHTEF
jgi:beta-galactosidase